MQRGQATIEYLLLITALMLGMCVLVRFPTPVEWMARAIVHAVSHRPAAPGTTAAAITMDLRTGRSHPCVCPTEVEVIDRFRAAVRRLTSPLCGEIPWYPHRPWCGGGRA